ncbi:MAG TPA: carboxypeptidase regulatory-like domain-containing protein [Actinomycetota bacterium]|nr:carboxypeptidase regulatory-like domain-containing protein [Actinomycetota bacterium]
MAKLTGRVSVAGGAAAPGAVVELHNSAGDVLDQVRIDDDGAFTYHLVTGEWSLHCWDAEGHRATETVSLGEDDHQIEIELH